MGNWPVVDGQPNATVLTASLTGGGTVNTKGAWVQVTASTPIDVNAMVIYMRSAGVDQNSLVDIGVGAAAAELVLIPNLYCSFDGLATDYTRGVSAMYCPTYIPKGARVSARAQTSLSTGSVVVQVLPVGGGFRRQTPLGPILEIGTDTANSRGTAVTAGNGSFGSWTQLTASLTTSLRAIALIVGTISTSAQQNVTISLGIGGAGSEITLLQAIYVTRTSTFGGDEQLCLGFLPVTIPQGTRLSAQIKASGSTDVFYVAAYGLS